jgi:putative addiction module killer protein
MQPRPREVLHYQNDSGVDVFQEWLDGLKDVRGRAAVLKRIDRVEEGLFGDRRYVGEGVWELRVDFGPGYRVYYAEDGAKIVLLLLGGDKGSQGKDIRQAHEFWADYRRTR